jgi:hypothetical protein
LSVKEAAQVDLERVKQEAVQPSILRAAVAPPARAATTTRTRAAGSPVLDRRATALAAPRRAAPRGSAAA